MQARLSGNWGPFLKYLLEHKKSLSSIESLGNESAQKPEKSLSLRAWDGDSSPYALEQSKPDDKPPCCHPGCKCENYVSAEEPPSAKMNKKVPSGRL
jgi:hypothetical protein